MKKLTLIILLFQMITFSQKINVPKFTKMQLKNGLTILLSEEKKVPLIQFRLLINGGVRLDDGLPEGITSITTEMLQKGTTDLNSDQISADFELLGSTLNSSTSKDYSIISAEFLSEKFENGLSIISKLLLNSTFPKAEFDKLIKKSLSEIDASLEEPRSIMALAVPQFLFKNTPYAKIVDGKKSSLKSLKVEQIKNHFKKYFVASNSFLVLLGDFNTPDMIKMLEKYLGNWQKGEKLTEKVFTNEEISGKKLIMIDKPDVTQTQIRFLNKGISFNNPDYFSLQIANTVFGDGFTSRLVNEIRVKRSLSYGASSQFAALKYGGSFVTSTFTKNESVEQVFDVIFNELNKYRQEGPTDQEIEKAKNYLIGEFARSLQSPENLSFEFANNYFYNLPENYLETYVQNIKSVKKEEINIAIKKYFPYENMLMIVITNNKILKPRLMKYGTITEIKLKDLVK